MIKTGKLSIYCLFFEFESDDQNRYISWLKHSFTMSISLELSMALDTYNRTASLVDGRVQPEGIRLNAFTYRSPERHRRMLKYTEFDVCELSFGSYLAGFERDLPYSGIPVFPHRKFRHSYYFVNPAADIEAPSDLENKRVGIRRWQNTASVWMRGIAREYYDVDLNTIDWYIDDEDEISLEIPDRYAAQRIPDDQNINDLLASGELDAAMYPKRLSSFNDGSGDITRLFPDYKKDEKRYYKDTGIFPIMHLIVIKDEVLKEHPWVPMNLRKAFEEAKNIGLRELSHTRSTSLIWGQEALEEQEEIFQADPWLNSIEDNRNDLERLISYAVDDGLLSEPVEPEELFVSSSTETLPEYS